MIARAFPYAMIAIILLSPLAAAQGILEYGVIIEEDESATTLKQNITFTTEAMFSGNVFYIDQFGWEFDAPTNWEWNLTNWNPPFNVTYEGNTSTNGSANFLGFQGYYQVSGLYGYPTFTVSGPSFSFNILPGSQTFTLTPVSITISGITLLVDSEFNGPQTTLSSVATLLDASGNPITGATITHVILRPDGSTYSSTSMTATSLPGVYRANVSMGTEPEGPYTIAAQYGGTVNGQTVIKQEIAGATMIETQAGIALLLSLLALAGVGIGFISRTNPVAPFTGMVAQLIGWMIGNNQQTLLGTMYLPVTLMFAVCLLVLATKAFFMMRTTNSVFHSDEVDS